ncbi:MAG: VWA domain-containing protein [Holophagales bacterium]|nr:VWA domain-containing protein [Holophagales bacterium]MYH24801.1 VWA domain-containing protein [Holophagales bacterium]
MALREQRLTSNGIAGERWALGALGLVLCMGWSLAAAGQTPGQVPPADLLFGEEIDVRVVNVEVVVEDGGGNRVNGLTPDDFRIYVDGVAVGIDYFTEVLENRAVETRDGEAPPAIGDGESVPTNYVLFVDDDHTMASSRKPVLRGFADQLASLGLNDQVAVVVQSQRRLELLSPFTTDREQTRSALRELQRGRRFGGSLRSPRLIDQRLMRDVRLEAPPGARVEEDLTSVAGDLPSIIRPLPSPLNERRAETLARDLEFSISAVTSTLRGLDAPVGRKVLLLLAGQWPVGLFRPGGQGIGVRTDREMLAALSDAANLLGYTVYPVDQVAAPNPALWRNLRQVARDTGGRAYLAGSNRTALGQISSDVSNYYWLGFVPDYRRDDLPHEVRVEVQRPGLRVRSRSGYVDLSRRAEADMEAQGRLFFPETEPAPGEPVLRVEFGMPESSGLRKMRVPVTVHVPVGHFPVIPFEGQFLARLELRFAVVDSNGQQAGMPLIPIHFRGRSKPPPDAVMPYQATLTLRRKPHDLVVSIHDPLSRQTVSTRMQVSFRMGLNTTGGSP